MTMNYFTADIKCLCVGLNFVLIDVTYFEALKNRNVYT